MGAVLRQASFLTHSVKFMPPRLYCPQLPTTGAVTLEGGEVHHAKDVLRIAAGEQIELFDGRGLIAQASIVEIRRHELVCEIADSHVEPEPTPRVTLATAVPKGERFDWLVEKATELGVARLIPLQTERSSVDPRDSKLARLRQTIIAACKQSRRAHLMELAEVMPWPRFLETHAKELIVAYPCARPLSEVNCRRAGEMTFAVGPEGGFSPGELAAAEAAGCSFVGLGQHLLRIETAGIVLAGWTIIQKTTESAS